MSQFLLADKVVSGDIVWTSANHPDYQECRLPVILPNDPSLNASIIMLVHTSKLPRKYTISVLIGGEPVLRLDVNPGRCHTNRKPKLVVRGTHWQQWPQFEAELDVREMELRGWFSAFCRRINLRFDGRYAAPPFQAEQIPLL